jgi:Na+-driven multidrug efflux pump
MAHQPLIGIAIIAASSIHSLTNAFVPLENHAKISSSVSVVGRRRLLPLQGYPNNNLDDNNMKDRFITPEPSDPTPSPDAEVLFNEESAIMNEISSPPIGLKSSQSEEVSDVNAQDIFAENNAILSSLGDDTFGIGFDLDFNSNTNPTDADEDVLINEDLKAVLVASGEAAAAAEASMPPELVEVLDELAIEAVNATTLNSNNMEKIEVSPPEVVPTIATITPIVPSEQRDFQVPKIATIRAAEDLSLSSDASNMNASESSRDSEDRNASLISTPSVRDILKFAVPAIGVWLCGPILSLIDTSAVGILSGTVQQAALNPAVAVTDYAALLIAFLYTGTTNMIASAQESDRGTSEMPRTAKMMIGAMRMSTYVGAGLGAILFAFARPLLNGIIGNDSISPAVFAAAMKYVRIRALGMPAAAIIGSTQAACLGMKDIRSPLYVLGAAALVNLLGDIVFVGHPNPLVGGTAGAAWATVLSQYAALAFFVRWLSDKAKEKKTQKPLEVMNLSDAILEMTSKSDVKDENGENRRQSFRNVLKSFKENGRRAKKLRSSRLEDKIFLQSIRASRFGNLLRRRRENSERNVANATLISSTSCSNSDDYFSTRGFLKNRLKTSDFLKPPDKETRKKFRPYLVPVTTTQVGRVSGYVAMAHVVASSLGTVSMAAQQVIVSIFYCLCPIADSLSLTAQTFVPAISAKEANIDKATAMKNLIVNFLKAGGVFGGAMMAAVCGIPLLTGVFTADQAVINLVNSVVPLLLVFFGVHGFVCGAEGILLGQKDLGFLGKMYAFFFAVVPYLMLGVKKKALAGSKSVGLKSVWAVFIGYQLARCGFWLTRTAILQRRLNIKANSAASTSMDNILAP